VETDVDIAIVGFGPTGALAACLAAQAGFSVLVIDRDTAIYDRPRAIALDHEVMRLFQQIGIESRVAPYVAPFPASVHFGADGQPIRRVDMVPPPWPLGYVPTMVFSQPLVEAILRDRAASFPQTSVRLGTTLTGLEQDDHGVTLDLHDGSRAHRLRAARVIGCDGATSTVRKLLGLPLRDLGFDEPWLVVDLLVSEAGLSRLPELAAQYCDPARPISYIVGPGNHRRWEIMLNPGEDPKAMEQPEQVWSLLARWLAPDQARLWRAASYRFHALVAERWRENRVFLAGDAAHQQPPFLGQGMCQGLRDAANLIWKLDAVCHHGADPRLLDTYGAERAAHVALLTARITEIGRAICLRDPEAARARDQRLRDQGGGQAPVVLRQDVVPPLTEGFLSATPHPARGSLFPQPRLADGRLMDTVFGCGWRLVAACPLDDIPLPDWLTRVGPLDEAEGVMAAWFARYGAVAALVRPDHYVYGVATAADAVAGLVGEAQARLFGQKAVKGPVTAP
jgi:3-(3-hydroxy-phenyl)propionate hydroxylase